MHPACMEHKKMIVSHGVAYADECVAWSQTNDCVAWRCMEALLTWAMRAADVQVFYRQAADANQMTADSFGSSLEGLPA